MSPRFSGHHVFDIEQSWEDVVKNCEIGSENVLGDVVDRCPLEFLVTVWVSGWGCSGTCHEDVVFRSRENVFAEECDVL